MNATNVTMNITGAHCTYVRGTMNITGAHCTYVRELFQYLVAHNVADYLILSNVHFFLRTSEQI